MLLRYEFFYGVWTSFTYDRIFSKNYFKKKAIRWGIVLKETNVLIGTIGLNNLQLWSKRSEIGYDLHPRYWGNGYASEAAGEIINYGFKDLGLFRIELLHILKMLLLVECYLKLASKRKGYCADIFIKEISNTMHYCIL